MSEGPELTALADALRALAPRPGALDRDDLLFRAGQASVPRPRRWPWLLATALSSGAAVALGAVLLWRPPTVHTVEHVVTVVREVQVPAPPVAPTPSPAEAPILPAESVPVAGPQANARKMQDQLLRWGLDGVGLPCPSPMSGPPLTIESLREPY